MSEHLPALLSMPGFDARIDFGSEPVRCDDRKELGRRLRQAIRERFVPMTDEEPRRATACELGASAD